MPNQLIIPIADLRIPRACVSCGAPPAKFYKFRIERRLTFKVFGHEVKYDVSLPLCKSCSKLRLVKTFTIYFAFYILFLGLVFLGAVLGLESPLLSPLVGVLFVMTFFERLGFIHDLILWFALGFHIVLLRKDPPRVRLTVRNPALFRYLRNLRLNL